MRLFFLALLLANLAAWFWRDDVAAWLAPRLEPAPAPQVRGDAPPPLVLLAEREGAGGAASPSSPGAHAGNGEGGDAAPAPPSVGPVPSMARAGSGEERAAASPPPPAPSPPAARGGAPARGDAASICLEIGPWTDPDQAAAALAAAEEAGMAASLVQEGRAMPTGYWVLSPVRYDLAGARVAMRELEEKGVEDLAIVSLDDGHAVSLGIFSRASAMERRRRELTDVGYPPDVRRRSETRPVDLLVIERGTGDDASTEALLERLGEADPALQWRERPCAALL